MQRRAFLKLASGLVVAAAVAPELAARRFWAGWSVPRNGVPTLYQGASFVGMDWGRPWGDERFGLGFHARSVVGESVYMGLPVIESPWQPLNKLRVIACKGLPVYEPVDPVLRLPVRRGADLRLMGWQGLPDGGIEMQLHPAQQKLLEDLDVERAAVGGRRVYGPGDVHS